jgi:RNA polymerase sigma-70 factor, ECF subfamily
VRREHGGGGSILDDRTLVGGLLQKDGPSERFFFHTYRPKLYRIATFILGNGDPDVEDVVQETFLAALQDVPKFEFRCTLLHWLRRICVFRCYDRIRRRKRQVVNATEELENLTGRIAVEKAEEKKREGERGDLLQILKSELEALGERCREILNLRDRQNKNYAEISKLLKVPIGTVMSRLARCKEELRQRVLKVARRRGIIDG